MGWDVELRSRKTGKTMTLANPFYKRGSNIRAEVGLDGKLHPIVEDEADLSITFNYSGYYYEAGDDDVRFRMETEENAGLRALHGKTPYESISMLSDMIQQIQERYTDEDGNWIMSERTRMVYYDADGKEIKDQMKVIMDGVYARKEEQTYLVSEGDVGNYWEETAANAIYALRQMLHMATDLLSEDCVWYIE